MPNIPLAKQEALERLEATPLEAGEGYFLSYHSILLGDNCKGLKVVNLKSYYCYENCSYDIQAALIKDATEKVVVSSWKTPAARGSMVPPSQGETTGCLDSTATGAQLNTDQHYDHIGSLANTYGGSSSKKIIDSRGKETVASASASVSATAPKVSFTSPASRRSTRSTSTSASVSKHTSTPESATGSFNTADSNCNYFQLTQAQSGPDDQDEDLVNISGSQDSHSSVSFQSPASAGVIAMSADDGDVNDSLNISFVSNNSVSTRSSRSRHAVDAVTYNTDTMYTVDRKVAGWSTLSGMISDKDLIENLKRNKIAAAASLQRSGDKTQRCDHIDVQQ